MSKDSHFRRRMSINKFHNRPPFNLKKSDGATSTGDRRRSVAATPRRVYCDDPFISAAKICGNAGKYIEKIEDPYRKSMKNKNKTVIPKVIESFQKVTPKKRSKAIKNRQKSDSLHTLYRKNVTNYGKNVPNHKLMKKLLKNYDNEDTGENTECSYEQVDVFPSRDGNRSIIKNSRINLIDRVDKTTSTTGLQWPAIQESDNNYQVNLKPSIMNISNKNFDRHRTRIPQKKLNIEKVDSTTIKPSKFMNFKNYTGSKKSVGSYELEYFPTKEGPSKKPDYTSKIPTKQNIPLVPGLNKLNLNKEFPKYKFNLEQNDVKDKHSYVQTRDTNRNGENVQRKRKEKSFVQVQVDKYNKISSKKNANTQSHLPVNSTVKNYQEVKKNINKNYMNIMSTMRENLPQLGEQLPVESRDGSQGWSDNTPDTDVGAEVKFPKETRNAMQHMIKNMTRIPLAKCIKNQNLQLHPAISINSQYRAEYEECRNTLSGASYKKMEVPCSKNREMHDGTYNRIEKGHRLSRYNHRIRPNHRA